MKVRSSSCCSLSIYTIYSVFLYDALYCPRKDIFFGLRRVVLQKIYKTHLTHSKIHLHINTQRMYICTVRTYTQTYLLTIVIYCTTLMAISYIYIELLASVEKLYGHMHWGRSMSPYWIQHLFMSSDSLHSHSIDESNMSEQCSSCMFILAHVWAVWHKNIKEPCPFCNLGEITFICVDMRSRALGIMFCFAALFYWKCPVLVWVFQFQVFIQ